MRLKFTNRETGKVTGSDQVHKDMQALFGQKIDPKLWYAIAECHALDPNACYQGPRLKKSANRLLEKYKS